MIDSHFMIPGFYDMYDLYDLAHVARWEPHNLHGLSSTCSPGFDLYHAGPAPPLTAGGEELLILRGGIVNRTYGTHKKTLYLPIFTNNIWSYLLWSPVVDRLYL